MDRFIITGDGGFLYLFTSIRLCMFSLH